MSAKRWSDSCVPLLAAELEKQSGDLDITWEMLTVPVMGMGEGGRPVIGPATVVLYISIPSLLLKEPPMMITAAIPMFDTGTPGTTAMTEEKIPECVAEIVAALREGRSKMLAAASQALTGPKPFKLG